MRKKRDEKKCAVQEISQQPDAELDAFVARLARRIASFPADAVRSTKQVLNELTLPGADAIRADARRFQQLVRSDTVKARLATFLRRGCRPVARSNSTSATASNPCDRRKVSDAAPVIHQNLAAVSR